MCLDGHTFGRGLNLLLCTEKIEIHGIQHAAFIVESLERSVDFYHGLLGKQTEVPLSLSSLSGITPLKKNKRPLRRAGHQPRASRCQTQIPRRMDDGWP